MKLNYKNTDLEIFIDNKLFDYDINKDIDIELLRENFNNRISDLSQKNNSLEYWTMRIVERNSLVHNLFLDICRIELINKLIQKYKNIEIYTNNSVLYIYFKKYATISLKDTLKFELKKLIQECRPYLSMIKFMIKKAKFAFKFKDKRYMKDLSNTTIIQTWVSDTNFKNDVFKDSYYGDLVSYLEQNKKKTITWPVFYNVKNSSKAIKFIRENSNKFLMIEDYLKINDYIFAIGVFLKKRFFNLGNIKIDNKDYTKIFKHYQNKEVVEQITLFYSFTKRLSEVGNKNITFINHHENMIPEKALILGVKKYLKDSKVLGYFHTTKPKNQLCLEYANYNDYKIAPKPDAIIFNSDKYKKYYETKYPKIPMYRGVAFKQLHLKNQSKLAVNTSDKVLVLFSGTNDEIKLMFDLLNSLENRYEFIFRMHPMNQFSVKTYYQNDNYEIKNEISLDGLLNNVSKVISTYSAVAVESALKGLEVGLVYNKKELLINPFDDTDITNYQLVCSSEDLKKFLLHDYDKQEIEQIFNVEDEDYKIFLEESK